MSRGGNGTPGNCGTSSGASASLARGCFLAGIRMAPVEHLVADTSAFLRGAPLQVATAGAAGGGGGAPPRLTRCPRRRSAGASTPPGRCWRRSGTGRRGGGWRGCPSSCSSGSPSPSTCG